MRPEARAERNATSESPLSAEYRRLMRWYPRPWRLANEEAMLGALLDQAESEGRLQPTAAERSAIAKVGLAQRFGFATRSSSPTTLLLGGIGIVIATLNPLVGRAVFMFPVSNAFSWLNQSWQALPQQLSAGVLVVALTILAIGIGKESGIPGTSVIGKLSLMIIGVAALALSFIDTGPMPTLGTNPTVLAFLTIGWVTGGILELAALTVASIVVFRAGVVRGIARWGLLALAITLTVTLALGHVPIREVGEVDVWGYPVALVIQLFVGLSYALSGRTAGLRNRLPAGTARI
jgi:hypothetical protein